MQIALCRNPLSAVMLQRTLPVWRSITTRRLLEEKLSLVAFATLAASLLIGSSASVPFVSPFGFASLAMTGSNIGSAPPTRVSPATLRYPQRGALSSTDAGGILNAASFRPVAGSRRTQDVPYAT